MPPTILKIAERFILLILMFLLTFCSTTPDHFNTKMLISSTLGQEINLDMIYDIKKQGDFYQLLDVKEQYDYMAIVHLKNDCGACFSKFMNWVHWINSDLNISERLAILFLTQDIGFDGFIMDLLFYHPDFKVDSEQLYFTAVYKNLSYELKNEIINKRILDEAFIIDKHQKVRFIGDPFSTKEMLMIFDKLFDM